MNFVDKFIDLVEPQPRKIIRYLKLYQTVEKLSKEKKIKLEKQREKYLQKLKENGNESNNKKLIEENNIELLNYSDFKLEIISELKYIVENEFIKKVSKIVEEGKKECDNNNINSPPPPFPPEPEPSSSDANSSLHKKRNKSTKEKKNVSSQPPEDSQENLQPSGEKQKLYCICKKPYYGAMIECENPNCTKGQWFHYSCVQITEGKEPKTEWYCSRECREQAKNTKKKKRKKIHN